MSSEAFPMSQLGTQPPNQSVSSSVSVYTGIGNWGEDRDTLLQHHFGNMFCKAQGSGFFWLRVEGLGRVFIII